MFDSIVKIIGPHYCYGCSELGVPVCNSCKYDIKLESFTVCLVCLKPITDPVGICQSCRPPFSRAWAVGSYDGTLRNIINAVKFERNIEATKSLAELLDGSLPVLSSGVTVSFIPTLSSHRRQRGYDQSKLIARHLAQKRRLDFKSTLIRKVNNHQRGFSAKQRWINARAAYEAKNVEHRTYLLIDDVMTSGATLDSASRCLLQAGAKEVWIAVVARQTLD